jgi:hypothetical protein
VDATCWSTTRRGTSASGIADAAVMFCRADSVTGQTLVVDGGMPQAMNFG